MEKVEKCQRRKDKLFRLAEDEEHFNTLIEYAYRRGFISRPSLQQFMEFTIRLADEALKRDFDGRQGQ